MSIDEKAKTLHAADWAIIAGYFVLCIAVGLWSKFRKQRGRQETAETYFLAGRSMLWWAVGPSLFASNMGSEHFIGLAGSGAATGIGVVAYEWQACWVLLLLGWVFVPIYLKSRIYTMPEFLKKRFQSRWIRTVITIIALVSYIFTKTSILVASLHKSTSKTLMIPKTLSIASLCFFPHVKALVDIYAGSVFLYEAIGWNIYISSACILAITAIYTMLGGLMAVIFTDVLQCVIMIIGAIALAITSFIKVGGIEGLWQQFPDAVGTPYQPTMAPSLNNSNSTFLYNRTNQSDLSSCYKVTPYWGNMLRPLDDPDYPWLGVWTTLPIMGIWYWCTDQVIVQRALGAKSTVHAKAGTILAGFLKILPIFIMVMPGMISRVLFKDSIGCADKQSCKIHCDNEYGCTNNAYPKLVLNVLPIGMVGLMMAVMMAALMSSLSSAFNSSATIFTVDVWDRFRPKASQREQLIVGRVCVFVLVVVSLCWLPIIQGSAGKQLFVYIQTVQSYLAPPLTVTFTLGILWPGLTEAGALSGIAVGILMGLIKFIVGNVYTDPVCGEVDNRPGFAKLHFMYYALIVSGGILIVMIVVSMFTKEIPRDQLGGLTWSTIDEPPLAQSPTDLAEVQRGSNNVNNEQELQHARSYDNAVDVESPDKNGVEMVRYQKTKEGEEATVNGIDIAVNGVDVATGGITKSEELIKLEVVRFPDEPPAVKWTLRLSTVALLLTLVFLWEWYR